MEQNNKEINIEKQKEEIKEESKTKRNWITLFILIVVYFNNFSWEFKFLLPSKIFLIKEIFYYIFFYIILL